MDPHAINSPRSAPLNVSRHICSLHEIQNFRGPNTQCISHGTWRQLSVVYPHPRYTAPPLDEYLRDRVHHAYRDAPNHDTESRHLTPTPLNSPRDQDCGPFNHTNGFLLTLKALHTRHSLQMFPHLPNPCPRCTTHAPTHEEQWRRSLQAVPKPTRDSLLLSLSSLAAACIP